MRKTFLYAVVAVTVCALLAANAQAAFMVETWSGSVKYPVPGLANDHYSGDGILSSDTYPSPSRAVGVTAASAVFGGTSYVFSYTPSPGCGGDEDNVMFAAGTALGNGNTATGLLGGTAGFYNIYATWRASDNVDPGGVNYTVTLEGDDKTVPMVQQKTIGGVIPAGSDNWFLVAERVRLMPSRTYTLTQKPNATSYVSMRNHGVMWELVEAEAPVADIVETEGITAVEEGGDVDEYTIVLKEQPPDTVVVTAEVSEPNQVTLNGESSLQLVFTPDNWNVEQHVIVEAWVDGETEPQKSVCVLHMTDWSDPNGAEDYPGSVYTNGYAGVVVVEVRDYDVPGVKIVESGGATEVSENGPTSDTYLVKLMFPPTDPVIIKIATDGQTVVDTGSGEAQNAELVFTPANWQDNQVVTVTAVDDDVLERNHYSTITHTVESELDGGYDGIPVRDVTVSIEDNECGVWGYPERDVNKDCYVDLGDLAMLAQSWLDCTQPYGDGCVDLR